MPNQPLFLLALTVAAYAAGDYIYQRMRRSPFFHPVASAVLLTILALVLLEIDYDDYVEHSRVLPLMLGPAVVALAIPLYDNLKKMRASLPVIGLAVLVCGAGIGLSSVAIAGLVGLDEAMVRALISRSVTAPVALAIASETGGSGELAILVVFITGMLSVMMAPFVFRLLSIRDEAVQGFTLGLTAHTFGVARALEISPKASAFAALGMGLTAGVAALVIPMLLLM